MKNLKNSDIKKIIRAELSSAQHALKTMADDPTMTKIMTEIVGRSLKEAASWTYHLK
jgi:hypothetical protein